MISLRLSDSQQEANNTFVLYCRVNQNYFPVGYVGLSFIKLTFLGNYLHRFQPTNGIHADEGH